RSTSRGRGAASSRWSSGGSSRSAAAAVRHGPDGGSEPRDRACLSARACLRRRRLTRARVHFLALRVAATVELNTAWRAAPARCTVSQMSDDAAIRAWHGTQPGGHRSHGPTLVTLRRNDDGKLVELDVADRQNLGVQIAAVAPTPAAWWCECGEPLHGGYGPI